LKSSREISLELFLFEADGYFGMPRLNASGPISTLNYR
jgi:hypothetical protein